MNLGMGLGLANQRQGITYDTDAQTYFDRVETASGTVVDKALTNARIVSLKSIIGLANILDGYLSCAGKIKDGADAVSKDFSIGATNPVDVVQATGSLQPLYTANGLVYADDRLDSPAVSAFGDKFNGNRYISGSAWLYPTTLATGTNLNVIIITFIYATSNGFYITLTDTGKVKIAARSAGADSLQSLISTESISINNWHHLAFTVDFTAKTINIWINGSNKNIGSLSFSSDTYTQGNPTSVGYIGNYTGANQDFAGTIEGLIPMKIALDQTKVNALYALGR